MRQPGVSVTVVRQRRAAKCGNVCLKHVAVFLATAFLGGNIFFRATGARHPSPIFTENETNNNKISKRLSPLAYSLPFYKEWI
jgi:hypothetical protein